MEKRPGPMEMRFAELIWENEPIPSGALVALAAEKLGWKKSTTYTMLRRLCERGIFQNENAVVSARLTREQYAARESEDFVASTFGGSLPMFVASFTSRNRLSKKDIDELQRLIDESRRNAK